jgi:hypothetical protein
MGPLSADGATPLRKFLLRWPVLTFILMGLCFLTFSVLTLNLVYTLQANIKLLLEHGWMAVMDGGLQQLLELLASGYFGVAFYLLFKTCESTLVERLLTKH